MLNVKSQCFDCLNRISVFSAILLQDAARVGLGVSMHASIDPEKAIAGEFDYLSLSCAQF